jgi:hypothetical protein
MKEEKRENSFLGAIKPLIGILVFVSIAAWGLYEIISINVSKRYSGVVSYIGYEENKGYYKYSSHPVYFIMLDLDSVQKSIRVNVTYPCWYRMRKGSKVSFNLSRNELEQFGNGDHHLIK